MQKITYKICDDTYHAMRVINSCKTIEQLENANRWACSLIDKWYNLLENSSLYSSAEPKRYIDLAASDMTAVIAKQRKYIKSQQNEDDASNRSKTKETHQIAAKQKKRIKSKKDV